MTKEEMLLTKYDLLFESRLTKVETTMTNLDKKIDSLERHMIEGFKEIKTDLRWLLGLMIMFSGILLSLMAKGFHWFI